MFKPCSQRMQVGIIVPAQVDWLQEVGTLDLARPLAVITPTLDADVLAVLAGADTEFTGRRVHQLLGKHSERGVRNTLQRLVEQGIATRRRVGSADLYRLNRDHIAASHIEALAGLRSELLRRIREMLEAWAPAAEYVALFGSAARGGMRPDSDIDLFVVRPAAVDADDHIWQQQLELLTQRVTGWTGNDTRVLEMDAGEVAEGLADGDQVLRDVQKEGIALHGPRRYLNRRPGPRPRRRARA
jgi:predicted nucleotidyltransferase